MEPFTNASLTELYLPQGLQIGLMHDVVSRFARLSDLQDSTQLISRQTEQWVLWSMNFYELDISGPSSARFYVVDSALFSNS